MNTDHDPPCGANSFRLGGWVGSDESPSEKRVLDDYLKDMGATARLRPDEETVLAKQLWSSRQELDGLCCRLPEPWRAQVLETDGASEVTSFGSSHERFEGVYERLLELNRENPSAQLSDAVSEARRCKKRYDRARDAMIVANLRLVVKVVGKFKNRGIPLLDLIQEGNLGLIRAVEKFEVDKGYRFSTYAIWWIRHGLSKAFADSLRLIRLPAHVGLEIRRLRQRRRQLEKKLGRTATMDEIAANAGLPRIKVVELLAASRTPLSLDDAGPDDGEPVLLKSLANNYQLNPFEHLNDRDQHEALMELLSRLSERERLIVKLRLGIGCDARHTLARIGEMLDVSRERIRQIERRALNKLRELYASENGVRASEAVH